LNSLLVRVRALHCAAGFFMTSSSLNLLSSKTVARLA
jgi:hypothetical protein